MGISQSAFKLDQVWSDLLQSHANRDGILNYEDYSRLALYHPQFGYYAKDGLTRVSKNLKADFYTASTHTEVFPELIIEAILTLLSKHELQAQNTVFYELGAEPGRNPWKSMSKCFKQQKTYRLGDDFNFEKNAIIYSNELFDAQPFHRWLAQDGKWVPIHLKLEGNILKEVIGRQILTDTEAKAATMLPSLPAFEYHLDFSVKALELLERVCGSNWKGLFLAFDYGMMWKQLVEETPQGTARAYKQHQQSANLHHNPGEQDLTTHVCWDHLIQILQVSGFESYQLRTQSRFLMEESAKAIESIVTATNTLTDKRKSQLLELISPAFFGQKFQVLSAIRR